MQVQKCVDSIMERPAPASAAAMRRDDPDSCARAEAAGVGHDAVEPGQPDARSSPQHIRLETGWTRSLYEDLFSSVAANDDSRTDGAATMKQKHQPSNQG